ncbi:hypothetical protein L204_105585 [Cryptococcus depauperatus]|nr:hypothetical protein L204_02646 [Cryptococcus depauperatus CBS 7855]
MSNSFASSSRLSKSPPKSSVPTPKHVKHGRSKSGLPQPKILPFPDLPELRSKDSSRANSPLATPSGDRLEVTFDQLIMARGGLSDGGGHGWHRSSGSGGRTTPVLVAAPPAVNNLGGTTSPTVPSPLATATLLRARALTAPTRAEARTGERPPPFPSPVSPQESRSSPRASMSTPSVALAAPILMPPASSATLSAASVKVSHTNDDVPQQAQRSLLTSNTLMPTAAVLPISSVQPITNHLHKSFLEGTCADVRLIVKRWGVCYHVHKMILSQTSFFSSLFLGGFSEGIMSLKPAYKGKGKARADTLPSDDWTGEEVELQFDDPNITRAAFEISLSRLYSPYPSLHYPTVLLPTSTHPLTPAFPNITSHPPYNSMQSPPNTHLTTPRLLLSLLATTIYLGHGNLLREVLAMILRTIGPLTVNQYLAFAVGDGIGAEEWEEQDEEGAKSLQNVARSLPSGHSTNCSSTPLPEEDEEKESSRGIYRSRLSSDSETKVGHQDLSIHLNGKPHLASSRSCSMRTDENDGQYSLQSADARSLPHFYGVVGNKIGEACVCWLARWGVDLLCAEVETPGCAYRIWAHRGLPARFVRALLSSDYFFISNEMERYLMTRHVLELRRRGWEDEMEGRGDLSLGEEYEQGWEEWEEDEREIQMVFAEGIRYCHMTFDNLSTIASNIDSQTNLPYAPLSVLQAAHWSAADLKARVTAHEKANIINNNSEKDELGLTQSTSVIVETIRRRRRPKPRSRVPSPAASWGPLTSSSMPLSTPPAATFDTVQLSLDSLSQCVWYPIPSDETHRMGASGLLSANASAVNAVAGIAGVPDFGPDLIDAVPQESVLSSMARVPHGEKNLFGLINGKATGSEIEEKWVSEVGGFGLLNLGLGLSNNIKEQKWTNIEPFRFSVEFWDVDKLGEKERYYSATHFYAGSLFNCYIQMIKRKEKGVQLGIYLHRQSPNDSFPLPSAPQTANDNHLASLLRALATLPTPITTPASPTIRGQTLAPSSVIPGSPTRSNSLAMVGDQNESSRTGSNPSHSSAMDVPYHDTRNVTKAFFSISCASALGTALIRFTSGPDSFAHSQSWGWKSSALKSEEYLFAPPATETKEDLEEGVMGWTGEIDTSSVGNDRCTLRAMVVVGVV